MRASDTDRQRVLDELRRHCRAGRLDMDEYGRRVEEAVGATTLADLDHSLRDLPMMRIDDPGSHHRGLPDRRPSSPRRRSSLVGLGLGVGLFGAAGVMAGTGHIAWAVLLVIGWIVGLAEVWLLRGR
ncbi:MAG: DUF1707 domain-containing protein [Acidimicrobiaceae bacterium]|nr:DUF1707 domain-containing protein [Acidimicrobiaceae bacterium]